MAAKWKLKAGTTWRDKLVQKHPNHGKIVKVPLKMQRRFGKGTMLIPRPLDIDTLIRKVKKTKLVTQSQLRQRLAGDSNADSTCPMTTGIFLRIVAEAAEEDLRNGKKRITPYWRVVKDDGSLNEKLPGGAKAQAKHLKSEGFDMEPAKGKKPPKVINFEKHLIRL